MDGSMYERDKPTTDQPAAEQADATSATRQPTASWPEESVVEDPAPGGSLAAVAGDLISAGIPAQEHIAAMRDHGLAAGNAMSALILFAVLGLGCPHVRNAHIQHRRCAIHDL